MAEEIYSVRKGVASFGVLDLLRKFPDDGLKKLMHVDISVEDVKSCFVSCFSTARTEFHENKNKKLSIKLGFH